MFAGKKSVDGIMATFKRTIEELEGVKQASMDSATQKRMQAQNLQEESDAEIEEAKRALKIADNLRGIIGAK